MKQGTIRFNPFTQLQEVRPYISKTVHFLTIKCNLLMTKECSHNIMIYFSSYFLILNFN